MLVLSRKEERGHLHFFLRKSIITWFVSASIDKTRGRVFLRVMRIIRVPI